MTRKIAKAQNEIWCKVGVIIQLSQMIEYNLTNILALDEILREFDSRNSVFVFEYNEYVRRANELGHTLESKPMGVVIQKAKDTKFFTDEGIEILTDVLKRRNHIAHQFFKDDLKSKKLENSPSDYFKRKIEILKNRCNIEDSEFDEIDTIKTPIEMKNNDETSLTKQNVTPSENPEIEKSPKTAPCPLCATEIDVTEEICPACGYDLLEWKYYNKK